MKHPFSPWAKTVGGILKVSGFTDFLANYATRKTLDDPVSSGLALLGQKQPDTWLSATDWARLAVDLGLVKTIVPPADRDNEAGRIRGVGVVLSAHRDETFAADDDNRRLTLRLEKRKARFEGGEPHVRYQFAIIAQEKLPEEENAVGLQPNEGKNVEQSPAPDAGVSEQPQNAENLQEVREDILWEEI